MTPIIMRATFGACIAAALVCVVINLMNYPIWTALAAALMALTAGSVNIHFSLRESDKKLSLRLIHPLLYSNALVLGPALAAVIGIIAGISQSASDETPLYKSIRTILKPAASAFVSSIIYTVSGGDIIRPQAVGSVLPSLLAALAYAFCQEAFEAFKNIRNRKGLPDIIFTAKLSAGFAIGYILAAIYSIAPSYIILPALIPVVFLRGAMTEKTDAEKKPVAVMPGDKSIEEPSEDSLFVDQATGLANKKYMEMFLSREISRAERMENSISIAVFNLNSADKLSQEKVDSALKEIGERLRSGVREYDIVARYSQHRLIVVLPEAHIQQTLEVVERLRQSASSLKTGKTTLDVSVGLSIYPDHGHNSEELINAAHYALNRGRFDDSEKIHIFQTLAKTA